MLAQCLFNIFRFAQVPRVSSCGGYCIKLFLLLLLVVLLLVLSEYYCIISTTTTSTTSTTTSATSTAAAAATTFTFINNAFFSPHLCVGFLFLVLFFRPTPYSFRQVVHHTGKPVAYWQIQLINAKTLSIFDEGGLQKLN
jgi:hypothetical protein